MALLPAYIDPYRGLGESIVTSNIIDIRDAFDISVSWRTTSAGTAETELQIANSEDRATIPEASWSNFTTFGTGPAGSSSTLIHPPLGGRWLRFVKKNLSFASVKIDMNKQFKTR